MRILDRYVAREFLKTLLLGLAALAAVYLIVDLFENMPRFVEARVPLSIILEYYGFSLPFILFQVSPVAVLMASFLSLGNLGRRHELLAMKVGRISSHRIVAPILLLAILLSSLTLAFNEYITPKTNERAYDIKRTRVKKLPPYRLTRENDVWFRVKGDKMLHISLLELDRGRMHGASLLEFGPGFQLLRRIDAQEARWEGGGWIFLKGYIREFRNDGSLAASSFSQLPVDLKATLAELARVEKAPEEMSYGELKRYIRRLSASGANTLKLQARLHAKPATAFLSLVMALIGVSFGLRSGKKGLLVGIGASLAVAFLYWVTFSLSLSLGYGGKLPPFMAAWLPNFLFGSAGLTSLLKLRG
ncbi:MAG: LPS export ABC transporter permease LptG [candidate division NC10 bacterium]|nr:LPS export ABC transporter permease LptG [candidate division NC10 bacterium]